LKLKDKTSSLDQVTFIFDNHSTQKNYYVLSYFLYLIKCNFFAKDNSFFHLIFMVAGHTHNRLDSANSKPRQSYYKSNKIQSINDLSYVYQNTGPRYNSQILSPVFDFVSELEKKIEKKICKKMLIKQCHQFKITKEGIYTKKANEEEYSTWRGRSLNEGSGIEPFDILQDFMPFVPKYVEVKQFSEERKKKISESFPEGKLDKILDEYLNWTSPFTPIVKEENGTTKQQEVEISISKRKKKKERKKKIWKKTTRKLTLPKRILRNQKILQIKQLKQRKKEK
jgi:hypothetical protein